MKKYRFLLLLSLLFLTACNFHEVDPGKMYRSAQLSGDQLQKAIDELGIKTVINLRGESPNSDWYKEEKAVTEKNGILQIDIGMSAQRLPHRKDLIKLLDAFRDAPRPILVHCQAGADRTGEAMALYALIYMGRPLDEAMKMLDPKYLHFEFKYPAKDYFVRDVWKGEDWARREYDPCSGEYKHYDPNNPVCKGQEDKEVLTVEEDT